MIDPKQLEHDLAIGGDESYEACALRLIKLGYRLPDCPDHWQVDRMTGAIFGSARNDATLAEIAHKLIRIVGVTQ